MICEARVPVLPPTSAAPESSSLCTRVKVRHRGKCSFVLTAIEMCVQFKGNFETEEFEHPTRCHLNYSMSRLKNLIVYLIDPNICLYLTFKSVCVCVCAFSALPRSQNNEDLESSQHW